MDRDCRRNRARRCCCQPSLRTYQFAVTVDDAAQGITDVVRGADLIKSTFRQILLYRALGRPVPAFFHCPLMLDDRGERPGVMFADWELIGVPHRITIGDKGLKEGLLEYQHRQDSEATKVAVGEIVGLIQARLRQA